MRKLVTSILLGTFALAVLGAPAEAKSHRCKAKTDLPGTWYISIVLFLDELPFANCKAVYTKRGGINVNKSSCTDSFGGRYIARFGSGVSLNRACKVSGQLALTAFGEGGQPNAHPILGEFQPGADVSVIVSLDNLRMVSDKRSAHGSGKITYAGPDYPTNNPRSDVYGALIDAMKK